MKKLVVALLFVAVLNFIFSHGIIASEHFGSSAEYTRYYNKTERFSIQLPKDWVVEERLRDPYKQYYCHPPRSKLEYSLRGDEVGISVVVTPATSFDQAYQREKEGIQNDTRILLKKEGEDIIDNVKAKWLDLDLNIQDGQRGQRHRAYYLFRKNKFYGINWICRVENFDDSNVMLDRIAKSFKFE
ncbi:MAG: PsbP-related protein [Candidatus Omnitrophota bacterium]